LQPPPDFHRRKKRKETQKNPIRSFASSWVLCGNRDSRRLQATGTGAVFRSRKIFPARSPHFSFRQTA
jgi:hypothetical protein